MTEDIVSDITEALESGKELEGLVRDILRILEVVSGMESTYLTRFEDEHETLCLLFTHNAGEMLLPEGIAEPSGDTLSKRSLQEGVRFAPDANLRWSDCPSIRTLRHCQLSQRARFIVGWFGLWNVVCSQS